MFFSAISVVSALFGLLALVFGLRLLLRGTWFWAWIRGMTGVIFVVLSVLLVLLALDLYSYRQLQLDKALATISFAKVEEQKFVATVVLTDTGNTREFYLSGDQWQIDARIIRWTGLANVLGGKPGYQLDRISGRYISLDDERLQQRTVHSLSDREYGFDFWSWVREHDNMPWVDATYGSATFVPMADGALFEVALSNSGLVAKPLNDAAERAVRQWR
jgi:hypothetical protein